MRNKDIWN